MQTKLQSCKKAASNAATGFIGYWLVILIMLRIVDDQTIAIGLSIAICISWCLIHDRFLERYFSAKSQLPHFSTNDSTSQTQRNINVCR